MIYFVRDEHANRKRQRLTLWSGQFASDYEGEAIELPKHNGFIVTVDTRKIRVECPSPRTETNYREVDEAINKALTGNPMTVNVGTLRQQSALKSADAPIIIVSKDSIPALQVVAVYPDTDGYFKIEVRKV